MGEVMAVSRKVAVSMRFDTVVIEVICGDGYEATVLYDDVVDRLKAGESITISLAQPASAPSHGLKLTGLPFPDARRPPSLSLTAEG